MSHRFFTYDERPELRARAGFLREAWPRVHARVTDLVRPLAPALRALRRLPVLARRRGDRRDSRRGELAAGAARSRRPARPRLGVRRWSTRRTATRSRRSSRRSRCSSTATATDRASARLMLGEMRRIAAGAGYGDLVAPVRPSLKSRYPLTPIGGVRHLDDRRGAAVRPVAARARAGGGDDREGLRRVDDHPGHGRRLGGVDGDAVPGERDVRRPRCARAGRDRRGGGSGRLRRAERLDASPTGERLRPGQRASLRERSAGERIDGDESRARHPARTT